MGFVIEISNMSYAIPGTGDILTGIDLSVGDKKLIGILGKNGAGKTTLVDLMMGFRRPTKGSISVLGDDPFLSNRSIFKEISYLSQDVWLKDSITLESFFEFHKYFFVNYSDDDEKRLVDTFELDYKSKIGALSTGQKRRVQIVAALASRPKILFVDEITAVLDPDARLLFFRLLEELKSTHGSSILLATNIVEDLQGRIDDLCFIRNSRLENHEASRIDSLFTGSS